ncbi:MAG: hypothetical protein E7270_04960 [Lachnospiraceae bacterium]|nr:hypothetical protein [Lachnospiraceae bacterium]
MKFDREEIKDLSQKKLLFRIIDSNERIGNNNLKCIEDVSGLSYLYAMFYDYEIKKEPNVFEMGFEDYIRIIMSSDKINGIAIDIGEDFLYVKRFDLRWFMIMSEEEKYLKDESDMDKMYKRHLENIRYLWLNKKYKDIEDYLRLIEVKYCTHASELNYYYGKIYEIMGYSMRAEQAYRKAVKSEGENIWLFYQLAMFYHRMGEADKEWNTCKTAYKQFCYLYTDNVYNEFIEKIVNMLLINTKCGWLDRKIYLGFIRRIRRAQQFLELNAYLVLD